MNKMCCRQYCQWWEGEEPSIGQHKNSDQQSTTSHVPDGRGRICGCSLQVSGSVRDGWTPPDELRCCSARRRVREGNDSNG